MTPRRRLIKSEPERHAAAGPGGDRRAASLSDRAFERVRGLIVDRKLASGEVLVEGRLAGQLLLTRTPLREALVRLEGAGFLVKRMNRSFAVRQVGLAEFFQSLKVRQYLESNAARLAAGRVLARDIRSFRQRIKSLARTDDHLPAHWILDDDLHNWLSAAGGNDVLVDAVRRLRITTQLFEIGCPFQRTRSDAEEHLAILDALEAGDGKASAAAVLKHLENIELDVMRIVRGH